MSQGQFWQEVKKVSKSMNEAPVMVGEVISLQPFQARFQGVEIGVSYGDNIYINNLLLDKNINLDVVSMDSPQTLDPKPWIANNSPNADYAISGTQKQFLTDFYNWTKVIHDRFILHIGDFVAIQKLGNNSYLILEKVQRLGNEQ